MKKLLPGDSARSVLMDIPLPLLPVHLLWINLVCDGLPALALSFDDPAPDSMERPPPGREEGLFGGNLGRRIAVRGAALGVGALALFKAVRGAGGLVLARSAALAALVVGKLVYLLEVRRSRKARGDQGRSRAAEESPKNVKNVFLVRSVVLSTVLFLAAFYVPGLPAVFGVAPLGLTQRAGVAAAAGAGAAAEHLLGRKSFCGSTAPLPA